MQKKKKTATLKGRWQYKMDLKPTSKKIGYALILSVFTSLLSFGLYAEISEKPLTGNLLSPEEFHLVYIVPILSFLASYFIVCWFVFKGADNISIKQIK